MDIIRPDKHTFSLIRDFLAPYEEKCVLLCSHVRKEDDKVFAITEGKNILGVLRIDTTLFHYIPEKNLPYIASAGPEILKAFSKILGRKKIRCISGEASGTDLFINILKSSGIEPYQVNNYKLMELQSLSADSKPELLSNDDEIVRFTIANIDELFSLQKKYLQDEVAPQGKKVSDLEAKMTLKQILKTQLCLVLVSDGDIAAKANTNAIGMKWVQIGGVYTNPIYRRNGYAYQLVYRICYRALKVHKNVALFVKEKNQPAIELYKKLGFEENGFYKIGYF